MQKVQWRSVLVFAAAGLLFFERELRGYADPGSGALLWQMLVGAFFGALYVVRRLVARFTRRNMLGPK
jgi:hypothetical protein